MWNFFTEIGIDWVYSADVIDNLICIIRLASLRIRSGGKLSGSTLNDLFFTRKSS